MIRRYARDEKTMKNNNTKKQKLIRAQLKTKNAGQNAREVKRKDGNREELSSEWEGMMMRQGRGRKRKKEEEEGRGRRKRRKEEEEGRGGRKRRKEEEEGRRRRKEPMG
ncbi:hypothetical protein Pmani_026791 [Petrolisthes manimaculis]|uniref:Uncharacterized protein n=1 Tax=Petrolisthes manimaculis TaxID=1843537 RepID=A0AAE1TXH7_9EUCA|nr:hypothetical protein Pmani_026791 [Petrolisthes manimaculis]